MSQRYIVKPNGMLQVYPPETYVPKNHYARNSQNFTNPYNPSPQNIVVSPNSTLQTLQNIDTPYFHNENDNYSKYAPNVKTPYPEFDCGARNEWSKNKKENDDMIEDCVNCLQNSLPEDRAFYCDGMCTSEYSLNKGQCSYNSLVASNIKECINPCQQKIPVPRNRDTKQEKTKKRGLRALEDNSDGCKDNSECGKDQECVIKNIIGEDGTIRTNVGVCEEKNPLYNPEKEKSFSIMNILNECTSDDWRICISDLSALKETEIKELIENKIKDSKENKTFDEDKEKIVNFLKKIKNDPELIKNGYDIVDNTISNLNYAIKELNSQYNLSSKEKGENIDTNEIKSEFILDEVKNDKNLKDKLQNILPGNNEDKGNSLLPNMSDDKKDIFIKVGAGVIIFLIVVLILILLFYRKGSSDKPVYKSIY